MSCNEFRGWKATRDSMPGPDGPVLRIEGMCTCSRDGYVVTLEPANEGIIDNPDVQVFQLRIQEPEFGPSVVTDEAIHYEGPADPQATKVGIRIPDQEPAYIDIEDVTTSQ